MTLITKGIKTFRQDNSILTHRYLLDWMTLITKGIKTIPIGINCPFKTSQGLNDPDY